VSSYLFPSIRVAIRGGGDLATGVAYRLHRCGFPVLITELPSPLMVRRAVSFGSAVIEGALTVDGIEARRADSLEEAIAIQSDNVIPVLVDPEAALLAEYAPTVLVDARMLKRMPESLPFRPLLVIGLGPGFTAPENCDLVIETMRGHTLGRVIRQGSAQADTGQPDPVMGHSSDRVLRAPADGILVTLASIGEKVEKGQPIAQVGTEVITAPFNGVIRGLIHNGLTVKKGTKVGDVDPRGDPAYCFMISDKSLAIGGGVLEAMFSWPEVRERIQSHR
jgi:xanthine dehydrogenase accessory factor